MSNYNYMSPPEVARENMVLTFKHVAKVEAFSSAVTTKIAESEAVLEDFYAEVNRGLVVSSKA